jgi:hypothetical protein
MLSTFYLSKRQVHCPSALHSFDGVLFDKRRRLEESWSDDGRPCLRGVAEVERFLVALAKVLRRLLIIV